MEKGAGGSHYTFTTAPESKHDMSATNFLSDPARPIKWRTVNLLTFRDSTAVRQNTAEGKQLHEITKYVFVNRAISILVAFLREKSC